MFLFVCKYHLLKALDPDVVHVMYKWYIRTCMVMHQMLIHMST